MHGEAVGVQRDGSWLPGRVLWEYEDCGRRRALVSVETPGGLVHRQLHWYDELMRGQRVLELPMRPVAAIR